MLYYIQFYLYCNNQCYICTFVRFNLGNGGMMKEYIWELIISIWMEVSPPCAAQTKRFCHHPNLHAQGCTTRLFFSKHLLAIHSVHQRITSVPVLYAFVNSLSWLTSSNRARANCNEFHISSLCSPSLFCSTIRQPYTNGFVVVPIVITGSTFQMNLLSAFKRFFHHFSMLYIPSLNICIRSLLDYL